MSTSKVDQLQITITADEIKKHLSSYAADMQIRDAVCELIKGNKAQSFVKQVVREKIEEALSDWDVKRIRTSVVSSMEAQLRSIAAKLIKEGEQA